MRIFLAAIALTLSATSSFAKTYMTSKDVSSINADIASIGLDDDGYFANSNRGKERIENEDINLFLLEIPQNRLKKLVNQKSVFFQVTRLVNGKLKLNSFIRLRGGFFGDDMDDGDFFTTVDQHGKVGQVVVESAKDDEVWEACAVGAAGAAFSGSNPAQTAGACIGGAIAKATINAVKK